MGWWRHLIVLTVAIVITVSGFTFWLVFKNAVGNFMSREDAAQQTAQPATNPGEVSVKIINQPEKPIYDPCTKERPCPKRPHE